jgi:hypothetical protein
MPGAELRTYVLGTVVSVLLGVGIGFGWHYFADSAGAMAAASAVTPAAQRDAPSPRLSCPPASREGPVLDVPPPAQKANRTQGVHRRSHMPHTPAARESCHLLVGLMGTEDSLLIERARCAASAR